MREDRYAELRATAVNWPGTHYHVGFPLTDEQILATVRAGRKCYLPHDPKMTDQRPYLAFVSKPEGAPKK